MTIVLADADPHFRQRLKKRLEKITGVNVTRQARRLNLAENEACPSVQIAAAEAEAGVNS